MLDLCIKWTVGAAVAWAITRRVGPANATAAHRVWLLVLLTPAWWAAGEWLFEPAVLLQVRRTPASDGAAALASRLSSPLLAVYAAVSVVLLVRVAAGVLSVRRIVRGSRPLPVADRALVEPVARGLADRVRHGAHALPVTAGFLRPVVLLPVGWQSLPADHLRAILHHEAAHVRRRDCAVALAAAVIEALFWFHPAAWLAASRVRWFAEVACDADAARAMNERTYARALLSLGAGWNRARRPRHALMAGAQTDVARRIHLLLDELERGGRRSRLLAIATAVLVAGLAAAALIETGRLSDGRGSHAVSHAAHVRHAHE